jgi:UDP-glucose 4-epimerase
MILIIGYGFLGKAIYESLKLKELEVCVVSRSFEGIDNKDFIKSELNDIPSFLSKFSSIKTIIHCIHTTVPKTSMDDNVFDVQSNVISFINLMEQCKKTLVENFVYISSGGAVYGTPLSDVSIDESYPTNPISSYGITKLTCEKYLMMNKHLFNGNTIILRPSNIYGIGQRTNRPQGIVGHLYDVVNKNKTLEIWGDGSVEKDYLYIDCFVDGIVRVVENKSKLKGVIFNIASGNLHSINSLINLFEKKFHRKINVVYKSENVFDVKNIALNNKFFSETFNWENFMSIETFIGKL